MKKPIKKIKKKKEIKEVEVQYPCDHCGKEADYNLQNVWKLYKIFGEVSNRDFQLEDEWEGDTNEFYCEECADKHDIT